MKQNWERSSDIFNLNLDDVKDIIFKHFDKNAKVKDVQLMSGGLSNSNFLIQFANGDNPDKIVLRSFKDSTKSVVEADIYSRLSKLLPTPTIYHHDETQEVIETNYILMEFIDGLPLFRILEPIDLPENISEKMSKIYFEIGCTLAKIHTLTFDSHGFFSKNLELGELFTLNSPFIESMLNKMLIELGESIPPSLKSHLNLYMKSFIPLLDELRLIPYFQTPRLIHGDFNEMNLLITEKSGSLRIYIIDWEYAMSGHPFFDLGNITRHIQPNQKLLQTRIAEGYEAKGVKLPHNWYTIARGFDLIALLQFLLRPSLGSIARSDIIKLLDQYQG